MSNNNEDEDPYPELPNAIDIGGDKYALSTTSVPVNLSHKSRKEFKDTFKNSKLYNFFN